MTFIPRPRHFLLTFLPGLVNHQQQEIIEYPRHLLFVMEVATRRVRFAGSTSNPDTQRMKQVARNLTVCGDGFLEGKRHVLMDRDARFCAAFRAVLREADVKAVRLPPRAPNLSAPGAVPQIPEVRMSGPDDLRWRVVAAQLVVDSRIHRAIRALEQPSSGHDRRHRPSARSRTLPREDPNSCSLSRMTLVRSS